MIDMTEKPILNEETIKNNIENALLWLGYEDVEFTKRFSTEEFVKGATGEDVLENEILYQSNSGLVPEPVAKHLAELLEKVTLPILEKVFGNILKSKKIENILEYYISSLVNELAE